jgi:8-oxo-dGTP pyrophosphatase MutT (NUDIX family)
MEPHGERNDMPPRSSATVVLLRDGAAGLEAFLLKRNGLSDVLGGAYVFPGGKLDEDDAALVPALDREPAALHAALGEPELTPEAAAALHVAAVRELFEETGVLLAAATPDVAAAAWERLRRDAVPFPQLAREHGWVLHASALAPWSRWITPLVGGVIRKRFDTRFFVARLPEGQTARHDEHEATEGLWLAPAQALRQYWDGGIELAPPQIMSLAHLARHASAGSVLAQARQQRPPRVLPEPFEQDGCRVLCYPGDPRHSVAARALPGPTRLAWRNRRFEPEGGLADLLGTDG